MDKIQRAQAYKERIDKLVGDDDPVDILSSTIKTCGNLVNHLTAESVEAIPQGAWSISDVLQHLVDAELVNGYRLRISLSSEKPELKGYDQEYWVQRFNSKRMLPDVFDEWTTLRNYNLRLIRTLTATELNREYIHPQRGLEKVQDLITLMAGHDLIHIAQIKRLLPG